MAKRKSVMWSVGFLFATRKNRRFGEHTKGCMRFVFLCKNEQQICGVKARYCASIDLVDGNCSAEESLETCFLFPG